jgi:hypothetical protein
MRTVYGREVMVGDVVEWLGPATTITVRVIEPYEGAMTEHGCFARAYGPTDSTDHRPGIALYAGQTYRVQE